MRRASDVVCIHEVSPYCLLTFSVSLMALLFTFLLEKKFAIAWIKALLSSLEVLQLILFQCSVPLVFIKFMKLFLGEKDVSLKREIKMSRNIPIPMVLTFCMIALGMRMSAEPLNILFGRF